MTNQEMLEELKAQRTAGGVAGTVTSAESQNKDTLAAALIAERTKPTAIRVPPLTTSVAPTATELEAACRAPLLSSHLFIASGMDTGARQDFVFNSDGILGAGYYHSVIEGRDWFVAPPLNNMGLERDRGAAQAEGVRAETGGASAGRVGIAGLAGHVARRMAMAVRGK
jgi:hypothetical protein